MPEPGSRPEASGFGRPEASGFGRPEATGFGRAEATGFSRPDGSGSIANGGIGDASPSNASPSDATLGDAPPAAILALIDEAEERIREHLRRAGGRRRGFVASDFVVVYQGLRILVDQHQVSGDRFCEWGSGFGVVALLATSLGFQSCGIEIQQDLVDQAEELARDFAIDVDYAVGSFVPVNARSLVEEHGYSWSDPGDRCGYEELALDPEDFDLFFAYPWPGEEDVFEAMFAQCAATGSLLLTYNGVSGLRVQRRLEDGALVEITPWDETHTR